MARRVQRSYKYRWYPTDEQAAELDAFADCVRTGTTPRVTGRDALAAFDLAVAADESWRSGRPVAVNQGVNA